MRPKFVLTLAVLAALALTAAFHFKQRLAPSRTQTLSKGAPAADAGPAANSNAASGLAPAPAPVTTANTMTPEEREAFIDEEIDHLQDLSVKDDPASLSAILNDLASPEKEIRLAAIEAAKQFGSRDAIPALKAGAANAPDADEQITMLEAAHFLSLPTIADTDAQLPKTADQIPASARGQQNDQDQNSQAAPEN